MLALQKNSKPTTYKTHTSLVNLNCTYYTAMERERWWTLRYLCHDYKYTYSILL